MLLIRFYNLKRDFILINAFKLLFNYIRKKSRKKSLIYIMAKKYYVILLRNTLQAIFDFMGYF